MLCARLTGRLLNCFFQKPIGLQQRKKAAKALNDMSYTVAFTPLPRRPRMAMTGNVRIIFIIVALFAGFYLFKTYFNWHTTFIGRTDKNYSGKLDFQLPVEAAVS